MKIDGSLFYEQLPRKFRFY